MVNWKRKISNNKVILFIKQKSYDMESYKLRPGLKKLKLPFTWAA